MKTQLITLKVFRFDPEQAKQPHLQTYEVPAYEGMSVMQALDYIYENLDASLAYYDHAACAQGICARCNILINRKMGLMCRIPVEDGMILEVPERTKTIKDLVYVRREK
jgi:succinate dehydrogenase/fumarate reductase-like Fe-S protein